jgi:signal transduction histidine kinase
VVAAQLECVAERALAQRMKDDFVNTVSHELRTPLTSIAGMLALLDAGRAGPMSEKAGHMIDVAHRNSLRLTRLVSDILDLGKIESGQLPLHMQAQALMPLIERAISENQAYAQGLGVSLAFEGEPSALAARVDTDRAIQILTNLMSNAAKFSPPGGVVRVSMQRRHDRVRIAVADRGPGIPKDFRSKIFTRFAQAEGSEGHQAAGTGLGLAIVQRLVQAMGGEVGFDTEEGVGTAFHIDLPWCLAETAAHSAAEAEASITA